MADCNEDQERADCDHNTEDGAELVGYGRPPKKSRFKPGTSGNPGGRPKRQRKSSGQIFSDLLNEGVYVQEGGRRKKITRLEALIRQSFANSFKGDKKSFEIFIFLMKHFGTNPDQQASTEELSKNDQEIIASYLRRG